MPRRIVLTDWLAWCGNLNNNPTPEYIERFLEQACIILTHETIHSVLYRLEPGLDLCSLFDNMYERHRKSRKYPNWKETTREWRLW